ncbi:MAG: hypothetical protein JWN04_235 [Myxococcaceae bacterium]|nr:hypothetical protein [Myxococcaceae bacterium]
MTEHIGTDHAPREPPAPPTIEPSPSFEPDPVPESSPCEPACCDVCGTPARRFVLGHCPRCLVASAHDLPEFVGEYPVLGLLGRGAGSKVYRVREPWSGREVAAKVLLRGEFASAQDRARFEADPRFLTRLQHPNIVQVYDSRGVMDDQPFYTMQLVEGGALAGLLTSFRDPDAAAQLIATLARAVQFCHDASPPVLHRDIKPGNILIGPGSHPYLTDFGIATSIDVAGQAQTKTRSGTPLYMSPEQASGGRLSASTDIYSLGVVLYELLTGRLPHQADTDRDLLNAIVHAPIVPPHRLLPKLKRDLSRICMTALGRRPEQRYATPAAFADDLDRSLRGDPPRLLPATPSRSALYWAADHPAYAWMAGALALIAALFVFGGYMVLEERRMEGKRTEARLSSFARDKASVLLHELRETTRQVAQLARELELELDRPGPSRLPLPLDARLAAFDVPLKVDVITLFDAEGRAIARSKPDPDVLGQNFAYREYFYSARQLAGFRWGFDEAALCLTHIWGDRPVGEIPIVAPMYDRTGAFAGALLVLFKEAAALGRFNVPPGEEVALLGPADPGARGPTRIAPSSHLLVIHPARGQAGAAHEVDDHRQTPAELSRALMTEFGGPDEPAKRLRLDDPPTKFITRSDYIDPLRAADQHWIAAFAPVGHTGYVAVVKMRIEDATRQNRDFEQLAWKFGLGWAASLLAFVALLLNTGRLRSLRKRRQLRADP